MKKPADDRKYLTPKEVSKRLGSRRGGRAISTRTLANWRSQGKGPKFSRFGNQIYYPEDELATWEESRVFGSTAEYAKETKAG